MWAESQVRGRVGEEGLQMYFLITNDGVEGNSIGLAHIINLNFISLI